MPGQWKSSILRRRKTRPLRRSLRRRRRNSGFSPGRARAGKSSSRSSTSCANSSGAFGRCTSSDPASRSSARRVSSENHPYYSLTEKVGAGLARLGFTVMTGGGPGVMEAASRGAKEAGGFTVGCNIMLPEEQKLNPYLDRSRVVRALLRSKGHAREVLVRLRRHAGRARDDGRALRGPDAHPDRQDPELPGRPDEHRVLPAPDGRCSPRWWPGGRSRTRTSISCS